MPMKVNGGIQYIDFSKHKEIILKDDNDGGYEAIITDRDIYRALTHAGSKPVCIQNLNVQIEDPEDVLTPLPADGMWFKIVEEPTVYSNLQTEVDIVTEDFSLTPLWIRANFDGTVSLMKSKGEYTP